ncbi:hypothetical protein Tco_0000385 [Tanacetum coccineum]
MFTNLKNMAGYKQNQLKNKSFDDIQKLFDKAMKRINIFVDIDTELVEGSEVRAEAEIAQESSSKRAGTKLEQESIKRQKVDEDKETAELRRLIEVVPDKEEVAIDDIPLATKPPSIVDYKIHKEGKKTYYQIIKADGSSKMYLVFSYMLKSFDKEDLETLFLSSSQNNSRINEVFGSILLVIIKLSMKKLEILKENIKFRGGLLGLKDFMMILELLLLSFQQSEWLVEDLDDNHLKELHCSTQCHRQMSMWIISRDNGTSKSKQKFSKVFNNIPIQDLDYTKFSSFLLHLLLRFLKSGSKDNEDPSWSTSFKTRRTQKTSSALESDLACAEIMSLRTQVVAQQAVITELQAADRMRQAAITEILAADRMRQAQFIEALKLLKRLQTQITKFERQEGPAKGHAQPDAPEEAGSSS